MASVEHTLPLRILHLEDSLADHRLTVLALRESGMSVEMHHVDILADFLTAMANMSFDAILADYQLAGFTALDAWRFVADKPLSPPFILLSGAIGEAAAVDAIRLGIADYVLKDQLFRLPHVISRACEVHHARTQRELAAQELAQSQKNLAQLTEHLQDSIEEERAAIAREIHDDIGGALTAIRFDLAWIERHAQDGSVTSHAHAATEMLQHALGASQRIMKNLRPPVLDQGLAAALEWLARDFEHRTGIPVNLSSSLRNAELAAHLQLVAYRTAQEALTNISKHAAAAAVDIDLSDAENVLTLEVSDNGQGMDTEARNKQQSFGLIGLSERAKTAGGWLDISSRPGRGTSVILSVPLNQDTAYDPRCAL
ncbi:hybrid sensor histidine kinase/response regulator [Simplicispira hankyongi]|uniref:Response regulator n=1 Tax=Simplicispira hankyongi TaxID=2315688 RepID=A0A398C7K6_9BURK|nr:ATP-binding protein [Simplicispira hankyongi]RID97207.1 response regulator [Simplicispira hankyongi]